MQHFDPADLAIFPRERQEHYTQVMAEMLKRERQRLFFRLFPDEDTVQADGTTIHARRKYAKHMEFFEAGARYRERCFLAANRVGKSWTGAYEVAAHLTGLYPAWWQGRRFSQPIRAWAAGKSNDTTRDIIQVALLGEPAYASGRKVMSGTGLVPGHLLGQPTWEQGVADLVDTIKVRHVSGKWSTLGLKSYKQGRGSFEGTAQHVLWLDEECPIDIYGECLIRTATTDGLILLTFTPLDGLTETVRQFMIDDEDNL